MRNLYLDTRRRLDFEKIRAEVERLTELEKGQTSSCYQRAAAFAAELLREKGFGNVETLAFPADGKTVFHDLKMPLFWEAETGSLRIPRLEKLGCDPVVADYRRHPFHLVKGSCALSDRPLEVRIVRETQMLAGEDVRDALILLEPMTRPQKSVGCFSISAPGDSSRIISKAVTRLRTPLNGPRAQPGATTGM